MASNRSGSEHPLRRREALIALGGLGAAAGLAAWRTDFAHFGETMTEALAADQCVLSPELTEGPFYVDNAVFRRNVTEGRPGYPLQLRLRVQNASSCKPIRGAVVEIWHADADGDYSGVDGASTTFLRGQQRTNKNGIAGFDTIYPGWYQGRAVHIHLKVHVGGSEVHTGQLFFRDRISRSVFTTQPYAARGTLDTPNSADGIFGQGGAQSMVKLKRRSKNGKKRRGYVGTINLGVNVAP
jgi:protocatechuate 3,4-dioxygenase beta subunit